jgi:hypothetical protein
MTDDFESITQYDKSFNGLFQNINHKGFACGFFSILSVKLFLKFHSYDKDIHESCIKNAIDFTAKNKITFGLDFDSLLEKSCNLDKKNICSTSVELVRDNIIGYDQIFENKENKSCGIIFLKNEKYFVILYDNDTKYYYIRDCHNNMQKKFDYESLKKYLGDSYQFEKDINLLGDEYVNYSSIEYIKIYEDFDCKLYDDKFLISSTKKKETSDKILYLDLSEYDNQEKIYTDDNFVCF